VKYSSFIFLVLFLFAASAFGQQEFQSLHGREEFVCLVEKSHQQQSMPQLQSSAPGTIKCGFGLSFEVARNWNNYSPTQKQRLTIALSPNELQADTVIGHFRIHYDTSGYNTPALLGVGGTRIPNSWKGYIDSVGIILTMVWETEIERLLYDPGFLNGQPYYNIYVESLYGIYGETDFTNSDLIDGYTPPRYTSYIRIDNDYQGYASSGMAGLKVTLAHEFHHAVQIGSYGFWSADQFFYEITSTWMEDVVFTEVNDYYNYLAGGQFAHPDISFRSLSGVIPYSRGIWGMFIEKKYSSDVMRRAWEYIRSERVIPAMDHALTDIGSSFRQAFLEWTIWNYNTGASCDTSKYYPEGVAYPAMTFRPTVQYVKNTSRSFSDSIQVFSSVYHPVCVCASDSEICSSCPKMLTIISNLNTTSTATDDFGFQYDLSSWAYPGFTQLSNGIFYHLAVNDPENWTTQQTVEKFITDVLVYPNPFIVRGNRPLTFKIPQPVNQDEGFLYIFTSGMDRIYSSSVPILSPQFEPQIVWNGLDSRGKIATSGIYFYLLSVDGNEYKGKFAVVR
jgi:hypothetical protein